MPVSPSRYELLQKRLDRFMRMLHGVGKGNERAVHRTRVASRRLRELLPVLQLEGEDAGDLGRRLRKVSQRLGRLRELDVTVVLIDELRKLGGFEPNALDLVASAVSDKRERARERLLAKWPPREIRRVESKLTALAEDLQAADRKAGRSRTAARGVYWAVDARIHRRAGELSAAIEDAGAVYLPERVHAVRVALKKFRYAVELANEITSDKRRSAQLRILKRSQDLLGRWHDRQVLIERVRQLQASLTPPSINMWRRLNRLVTLLETDCRRLHARYVRESVAIAMVCSRVSGRSPSAAERAS
jgi:CHAD domain-containing protein